MNVDNLAPCDDYTDYGYRKASPCIFIKFKKVLDWVPEFYKMGELNETGLAYTPAYDRFLRSNPEYVVCLPDFISWL